MTYQWQKTGQMGKKCSMYRLSYLGGFAWLLQYTQTASRRYTFTVNL